MKTVLLEFIERRSYLSTIDYADHVGRLADFLDWLEAQQEIKPALTELRKVEVNSSFSQHGFPPKPKNQTEVRAIGLFFLDKTKVGVGLYQTAIKIGVRGKHTSSNAQDYVDAVMEKYVWPLFDHIQSILESSKDRVSVRDLANGRFEILTSSAFVGSFPETNAHLEKIAKYCFQSEENGSWFHVAVSCRETLGKFVCELQSLSFVKLTSDLKQGDTKGILKQLVQERSDANDSLLDLIQAVWKHVQSNVHRQAATKSDALRVYLWTGLLISEMWLLTEKKNVGH